MSSFRRQHRLPHRRILLLTLLLSSLALLPGPRPAASAPLTGGLGDSSWPMFQHDARHTGRSPHNGPEEAEVKWTVRRSSPYWNASPVIGPDGTVYIYNDPNLYAFSPASGSTRWSTEIGTHVAPTPAVGADGTVYLLGGGKLTAVSPDGHKKWSATGGGAVNSSPAISPRGTIYITAGFTIAEGHLFAISPDGTQKWAYPNAQSEGFDMSVRSSPAIGDDGTVYVAAFGSTVAGGFNLAAVNPDGSEKWLLPDFEGFPDLSSPAIGDDGTIYVGAHWSDAGGRPVGYLNAVSASGRLLWSLKTGGPIDSTPAVAPDGTVYVASDDGKLYAVSPSGSRKWTFEIGARNIQTTSPAVDQDGTVFIGGSRLFAVSPGGQLEWTYATEGPVLSSPAIAGDGTLYVSDNAGVLYAFEGGPQRCPAGEEAAVAAACPRLTLNIRASSPRDGLARPGDLILYSIEVSGVTRVRRVTITAVLPGLPVAAVVPKSISDDGDRQGGVIEWTIGGPSPPSVRFALEIGDRGLGENLSRVKVSASARAVLAGGRRQTAEGENSLRFLRVCPEPIDFTTGPRDARAGEWVMEYSLTAEEGLVVRHVNLNSRYLARKLSLPYLVLDTSKLEPTLIRLKADGDDSVGHSRLVKFDVDTRDVLGDLVIEATYAIDRIPARSNSCLLVKQRYEFRPDRELGGPGQGCEPAGILVCNRFRPLVVYEFQGKDGEKLETIKTVQRLFFDIHRAGGNSAAIIKDNEGLIPPFKPIENPVISERRATAIVRGEGGDFDNYHQTFAPEIDLPDPLDFKLAGCPECVHIHWRWLSLIPFARLGHGDPIIPPGSTQSASLAVVRYRPGEDLKELEQILDGERVRNAPQVFYWISVGRQPRDKFHYHYAFFSPYPLAGLGR